MTPSKTEKKSLPARHIAYLALKDIFEKESYANLTLLAAFRMYRLSPEDRRFLTALVYGVCRRYNLLLWIISRFSSRPVAKLDSAVRLLLCLGLYQLRFLDSVPDSAAVNETVKTAKAVTHLGNAKFINAILRTYLREKEKIQLPSEEENPTLHDALFYNEPEWLVRYWQGLWGKEEARAVMAAFNEVRSTDVRMNCLRITEEDFQKELDRCGAVYDRLPFGQGASLVKTGTFFQSPLLAEGKCYVQNRASMIPPLLLAPQKGEKVLDLCAAPGSKTTQIAEMMGDSGTVDAWDLYPHKVRLIEANCRRLGIHSVHASIHDGTKYVRQAWESYDRVLADVPCSGLGVIGRKTEIRWRRKEKDLAEFPPLQRALLTEAAKYVKPGGTLVYSTCTLCREENEDMVSWFLKAHPEFSLQPFEREGISSETGMVTLRPDRDGSDGFFGALLVRRKA